MEFYDFPFRWECHHPNWWTPSFYRGVAKTHQPVNHIISQWYPHDIPFNHSIFDVWWWDPRLILGGIIPVGFSIQDGWWPRSAWGLRLKRSKAPSMEEQWPFGVQIWMWKNRWNHGKELGESAPNCPTWPKRGLTFQLFSGWWINRTQPGSQLGSYIVIYGVFGCLNSRCLWEAVGSFHTRAVL